MVVVVVEMVRGAAATTAAAAAMAMAEGGGLGGHDSHLTQPRDGLISSLSRIGGWCNVYGLIDSVGPTGNDFFTVNG